MLFFYGFAAAVILQRILEIKLHQKFQGKIHEQGSFVLMSAAHAFCFLGSLVEWFWTGQNANLNLVIPGIFLFLGGFFLRRAVIRTLGKYWSVLVEIREDQPLIKTGPYRLCRHPNYLAILLEISGYALVFQAYWVLGISLIFYSLAIRRRIQVEEKELIAKFGDEYLSYKKQTKTIIPYIF